MESMKVYILAIGPDPDRARHAGWVGEIAWPSVPPEGARWVHCGGFDGETISQVFYCGPGDDHERQEGHAPVQVVVRTTDQILDHLVATHGFTPG